jgi:beta-lactamase regulating signal transducer with metallopeptidase domain
VNAPEFLFKGILVALVGCLISLLFRRGSASQRYTVWLTTTVALVLLPLVLTAVPRWHLQVPGDQPAVQSVLTTLTIHPISTPSRETIETSQTRPSLTKQIPEPASPFDWATLWNRLWIVGGLLLVCRQVFGLWIVRRLVRSASPHLSRDGVDIRLSVHLSTPAAAGVVHPVILLPRGALDWNPERLEFVLAHELAHVRRADWLWINIATLMTAINVLNPLAWLVAAQLRLESEIACDDAVVTYGHSAKGYAAELVTIARQSTGSFFEPAVLRMARRTGLTHRIAALADTGRRRNPSSRRLLAGLFVTVSIAALALGACRVVAQVPGAQASPEIPFPQIPVGVAVAEGNPWIGTHSVRVVNQEGQPVPNTLIAVDFQFGFAHPIRPLVTDSHGVCSFSNKSFQPDSIRGDPAEVVGHASGYAVSWSGIRTRTDETTCTLAPSRSVRLRFQSLSGKPVEGVRVVARELIPSRLTTENETWLPSDWEFAPVAVSTDSRGEAVLGDLPLGYKLGFEASDARFVTTTPQRNSMPNRIYVAPVEIGSLDETAVTLTPAGTISGRVTAGDRPVANVRVQVNPVGRNEGAVADSDRDGNYRISSLMPGSFSVHIWEPPSGLICSSYASVPVNRNEVPGIDFQLERGGLLDGKVRYADGSTPDRLIQFELWGPSFPKSGNPYIADANDGMFQVRLFPGKYDLYKLSGNASTGPTFMANISITENGVTRSRIVLPTPGGPRPATSPISAFAANEKPFYGPARLKGGLVARLAFIQSEGTGPWQPDGGLPSSEDLRRGRLMKGWKTLQTSDVRRMFARVDIDQPQGGYDCIVDVPHRSSWNVWQTYGDNSGNSIDLASFHAPKFVRKTDLRLGIGHGPYATAIDEPLGGPILAAEISHSNPQFGGVSNPIGIEVSVPNKYWKDDLTLVGYDAAGKAYSAQVSPTLPLQKADTPFQFCFSSHSPITRMKLLVRPWDWVTFTGIHLYPNQ